MEKFYLYVVLFMLYSFLGWLMEVMLQLFRHHRFVNRGFLIGPICPIYGYGSLSLIILLTRYRYNPILLFLFSIIICSLLEYMTSYFMEKIFKIRWWDYRDKKFNLNGRICLETMIPFGILGTLIVYILNPIFVNMISIININVLKIISIILLIIYIIDNIISFTLTFKLKNIIKLKNKDATEELNKLFKDILLNKGYFKKRIIKAFPKSRNVKKENL